MEKKEKKVQYIELVYDLIFVYIVSRNNHLLHHIDDGIISFAALITYIFATLIVLQIWFYTSLYVNRYAENGPKLYLGIFVNMLLLYFMSQGIKNNWKEYYAYFCGAWALILINLACLYISQYRATDPSKTAERNQIRYSILTLLIQAVLVLAAIPVYYWTGLPLSVFAMLIGMIMAIAGANINRAFPVDFAHLTERVMLYVVFTFGEMVITVALYFEGFSFNSIYFALGAFLIIVGLLTGYGLMYDAIIDKELITNGTSYMLLHIFLILALNNITAALEFMREDEVYPLYKTLFLTFSFVFYYVFLFIIGEKFSKSPYKPDLRYILESVGLMILFVVLMIVFYDNPYVNIAVTVVYVASVFVMLMLYRKRKAKALTEQ